MPRGKKPCRRPPWQTVTAIAAVVTAVGAAIKAGLRHARVARPGRGCSTTRACLRPAPTDRAAMPDEVVRDGRR